MKGWAGRLGWSAQAEPTRPSSSFLLSFFFISSRLFDFKFGLEFEFKTEVTYSLEFREFCLLITLWFITLMEWLSIT